MNKETTIETAIVCHHLLKNPYLHINFPHNIDDDQAWCDDCEQVFQDEHGWTEEALNFADLKACCNHCFREMKESHIEKCLRQLMDLSGRC